VLHRDPGRRRESVGQVLRTGLRLGEAAARRRLALLRRHARGGERQGRAAVEFYKAAFGGAELYRAVGDDTNEEIVAQLSVGDGTFWVEDESPDHHNFSTQSLGGATERMLVIVDDPGGVVDQAKAAVRRRSSP
jgi:hypothetical protein